MRLTESHSLEKCYKMDTVNCCSISSTVAPGCAFLYSYFIKIFRPTLLDPLCEKSWNREHNPAVTDECMSSLTVSYKKGEKNICVGFLFLCYVCHCHSVW